MRGLNLTNLKIDGSAGSMAIWLPASANSYSARIDGSAGSITVNLPEEGDLRLVVDSSAGSFHIKVPQNAAVRFEVKDSGAGSLNVDSRFAQVRSDGKGEGLWQSAGYDAAAHKLDIVVEGRSAGSMDLRQVNP